MSTFASLREEDLLEVHSADGRFDLALPPRALEAPAGLVIETAIGLPPPPERYAFVGDAYRVASSRGDRLAVEARLEFNLDVDAGGEPRNGRELRSVTILRLTDDGDAWQAVEGLER